MWALICERSGAHVYHRARDAGLSFTPWVQGAPLLCQFAPALPFLNAVWNKLLAAPTELI